MLILAKITGAAASGYADYLQAKTENSELGDYYLKDGERTETPGRWAAGAEKFGFEAESAVSGEQLHTLMVVRRPDTGEPLRRIGGSGEAVSAIDATFSAPKSVSSVWALADQELRQRFESAHEVAIDRALTYATAQVPMLRRRVAQDTVVHEKAVGLVATSWRHTTARAVGDQVPDPQLHSHVLLHAAVRKDGELVAIDSRSWLTHQREVGAAYRTELARELNEIGFRVRRGTGRGGRYFEIDGVPQALLDRWSSRHQQVQTAIQQRIADQTRDLETQIADGGPAAADAALQLQALQESGQLSPKQERMIGTITRTAKVPVTVQDLDREWRDTALEHDFTRQRVEVLSHRHPPEMNAAPAEVVLDALTEFDAKFPAREARAVALERSAGAPINSALERLMELRTTDDILALADGSGTTRTHRERERTVVAITNRLANTNITALPAGLADQEADRLDLELSGRGGRLSDEQRRAIELACADKPLVVIEGQAGTGKSTTLTGIARAHHAVGQEIVITSTGALAAQRLADEITDGGVPCQAFSTAALQSAIDNGQTTLDEHTTVIHDEAALASTREQLAVLSAVENSGARLIEVGDPRQNQPVGAGGLWNEIEDTTRENDTHVELTINQRAHSQADRTAQKLFRDGHVERAIRSYAAHDHIHFANDQRRAEDQALEAAQADREAGRNTLVIAQTSNQHLDELNARAQAIRLQNDELGEDSLPVPGRPYELHAGDEVQIRQTLNRGENEPLRNGTTAEVIAVDLDTREIELRLADVQLVTLTESEIADADLRLAYVQHPFPAQGHTVDTTHLIVDDHATREGSYVGITRARETTDIYAAPAADGDVAVDRIQRLSERVNQTEPEIPSISISLAGQQQCARRSKSNSIEHPMVGGSSQTVHVISRDFPQDRSAPPESAAGHTLVDDKNELPKPAERDPDCAAQAADPRRSWPGRNTEGDRGASLIDVRAEKLALERGDNGPGFEP